MHAVNVEPPWYRQGWPWLLMLMPALAVVGGFITLWLAITSNNALVVDDYYREGKAINQTLARDQQASRLGLSATIERSGDGSGTIGLAASNGAMAAPAGLRLRLVHPTDAQADRDAIAVLGPDGRYAIPAGTLPGSGRWTVMLEDAANQWRLVGAQGELPTTFRLAAPPL